MNFVKNIVSCFKKRDNLTLSEENIHNDDLNRNENIDNDDVECDLLTLQSSGNISDLFNITDDMDSLTDRTKYFNDLKNTSTVVESEQALMDLDEFFPNLDCIEDTICKNNTGEENTCRCSQCVGNTNNLSDDIDESLFNSPEIERLCDAIENNKEKCDNTEFNTNNNSKSMIDTMMEQTIMNLNEFGRFCDAESRNEVKNTEGKSYKTESNANKSNETAVLHESGNLAMEIEADNNLLNLNEFDHVKSDNMEIETRNNSVHNNDQIKENSNLQDTPCNLQFYNIFKNVGTSRSRNNNIPLGFENASNTSQDNNNTEIQMVSGQNDTTENKNPAAPKEGSTITQIYRIKEDQNSIVFGVVVENNNFSENEVAEMKDIDVISISSTEETDVKPPENVQILKLDTICNISSNKNGESDYCSGYDSSDFEFISENEAGMAGIISNNTKLPGPNKGSNKSGTSNASNNTYLNLPGPSNKRNKPRRSNASKNNDINLPGPSNANNDVHSTHNLGYRHTLVNRENHRIPEGDDYLNLFQGIYAPALPSELFFLENKSIRPRPCMLMPYAGAGLGFDMRLHGDQEESDGECSHKHEAEENAKLIKSMYPYENKLLNMNRKRRRSSRR